MLGSTMRIYSVERFPHRHHTDTLALTDGVNIIAGEPNTGKTKWLSIIDYLLGDTDPAKKTLGDLANVYEKATMTIKIGDVDHLIERRWREPNMAHKIIVDGRAIDDTSFSTFILSKLNIPEITFPQGALTSAKWRTLTWRILLRHIYRHEDQWSDIVPEQPSSEQYACLMAFLGLASQLFPIEQGRLAEAQILKLKLETKKEQFQESLNEIAKQILAANEVGVAVTEDSVGEAIKRLRSEIESLAIRKDEHLNSLLEQSNAEVSNIKILLTEDWATHRDKREKLFDEYHAVRKRIEELRSYSNELNFELNRFNRAYAAGAVLSGIKVTHCPQCDQDIANDSDDPHLCNLCKRPYDGDPQKGNMRIELEKQQIVDELKEISDLIGSLELEEDTCHQAVKTMDEKIAEIETRLLPLRRASAAIQIPEVAMIDQEIGRKSEQILQWRRIFSLLDQEVSFSHEIDTLSGQIKNLESEIASLQSNLDLETIALKFGSHMNTYLNFIHQSKPSRWSDNNRVSAKFSERNFWFNIRSMGWKSALGGTWQGYLLLAYHYALMATSADTYYPGLLMLDFPKSFEGAANIVSENANHTIEPFIKLCSHAPLRQTQVIVAGKGFSDIAGANVIHFEHQWIAT